MPYSISDGVGNVLSASFVEVDDSAIIQLHKFRRTDGECVNFFYRVRSGRIRCSVKLTTENGFNVTLAETEFEPSYKIMWKMNSVALDGGVNLVSVNFQSLSENTDIEIDDLWVAPCKDISE